MSPSSCQVAAPGRAGPWWPSASKALGQNANKAVTGEEPIPVAGELGLEWQALAVRGNSPQQTPLHPCSSSSCPHLQELLREVRLSWVGLTVGMAVLGRLLRPRQTLTWGHRAPGMEVGVGVMATPENTPLLPG